MVELVIWGDGCKFWFLNGGWHRSNGPAVIYATGYRLWYWYSNELSEFEHMFKSTN